MSFSIDLFDGRRLRARAPGSSGAPIILSPFGADGRELGNVTLYLQDPVLAAKLAEAINTADTGSLGLAPMDMAPSLPIEVYWTEQAEFIAVRPADEGRPERMWSRIGEQDASFCDDDFAGWRSLPLRTALRLSVGASPP